MAHSLVPVLEGFMHFRLGVDAERVGHTIDVVEIGNDFDRIQDIAVGEPVSAQGVPIRPPDLGGLAGKLLRKITESTLARRKTCAAIVAFDLFDPFGITGFLTEILSVRLNSIKTAVHTGDHRGQQFAFGARQARGTVHRGEI